MSNRAPGKNIDIDLFERLWEAGISLREMAEVLGMGADAVGTMRYRLGLKPRTPQTKAQRTEQPDPTPQEIAERSAAIRDSWDDETRLRRAGKLVQPYEFPRYAEAALSAKPNIVATSNTYNGA
jgi:hypothetical protein